MAGHAGDFRCGQILTANELGELVTDGILKGCRCGSTYGQNLRKAKLADDLGYLIGTVMTVGFGGEHEDSSLYI
jgi:hypothetical protein